MLEQVLRASPGPLRLTEVRARLPRNVTHATLREGIEQYKRLGCVAEGSKGVLWTLNVEPEFWKVVESWEAR
jgi:hypothetical protein